MDEQQTTSGGLIGDGPNGRVTKRYVGTKTLLAWPFTSGEYNAYRGWAAPEKEDQTVPGYMVEYTNGGEPNVAGHAGYVSWSPADVFETSYAEIPADWRARVAQESVELQEKLAALRAFRQMSQYDDLPQNAKDLLETQSRYMHGYVEVLTQRLALAAWPSADDPTFMKYDGDNSLNIAKD